MLPLVCVVVLSWNGRDDTIDCLKSLARVTAPQPKVILVDNGSTDGTSDAVRSKFPEVEVIETGENLGYGGGNNAGIERGLRLGADYILVLNNDTVVDPSFLGEMIAVASRDERIGFVSPKIYYMESPETLWFAGAWFCNWCGYGRMVGYGRKDRGQHDRIREIDRPCGCAVLVTRRLCEEVGLMDPSLFLYVDEMEWALRARKLGFRAYFAPDAKVWHKVSASVGREGHPDALYYGVRNTLYAVNTHVEVTSAVLGFFRNVLVVTVFLASALKLRAGFADGIRATLDGVRDFGRSRMGRRGAVQRTA